MEFEYPPGMGPVPVMMHGHKRPDERSEPDQRPLVLTARQSEIVVLAAQGLSNKQIARLLKIAEGTVKLHLHTAYGRLGVPNRTALVHLVTNARRATAEPG